MHLHMKWCALMCICPYVAIVLPMFGLSPAVCLHWWWWWYGRNSFSSIVYRRMRSSEYDHFNFFLLWNPINIISMKRKGRNPKSHINNVEMQEESLYQPPLLPRKYIVSLVFEMHRIIFSCRWKRSESTILLLNLHQTRSTNNDK